MSQPNLNKIWTILGILGTRRLNSSADLTTVPVLTNQSGTLRRNNAVHKDRLFISLATEPSSLLDSATEVT